MKKTFYIWLLCISVVINISHADIGYCEKKPANVPEGSLFYKGTVDENMPVTMYLTFDTNTCAGERRYSGMYQYDKKSKWLQLSVSYNERGDYVFVEQGLTGIILLKENKTGFEGFWISPDAKRQLVVKLKKIELSVKENEKYTNILSDIAYKNNDC